jgi:hypothetical protein
MCSVRNGWKADIALLDLWGHGELAMTDTEKDEIFDVIPQQWGYPVGAVGLAVMFAFVAAGDEEAAGAAAVSTGVVIATALICRPLWRRIWFWIVMGLVALAHAAAVFLVPWPDELVPGVQLVAIGFADIAAVLALMWLLGKVLPNR